ncbi:MAG: lipopolysaccharide biosynthesis protein [Mediterranea massiliensis]|nr:lipopolysaccharide biosynthesis protein [Mediterranea massiliensis]
MVEESRTHKSIKNSLYGILVVVLNTAISFVTRIFLIRHLGVEVLGLNGLFSEVITMMSLAELGVGMAIIYSLYQPMYESDYKKISQLMSLFRSAYHYIAIGTLIIGLILLPFIQYLITDIEYPISYIRLVFILFVINTSSSYLFSYKTALLNVDQKQYIISIITAIIRLIFTGITIYLLITTENYVIYLIVLISQSIITNFTISKYVDRHYTYLDFKEKLEKEERKDVFRNIKNIFIKRLSGVITSSSTNVLISTLVSTIQVGYYSNYVMLFSPFKILRNQISNAITASIGNLSVSESSERCISVLKRLTFIFFTYAIVMSTILMSVGDLFIKLWLGEEFVMSSVIITVAILNIYLDVTSVPLWQYLEVSGLFKQDRNIAILGSTLNLIVAFVFGLKIGIVGIFLGTVCTQVVQLILKTKLLFKNKYATSPFSYYYMHIKIFLAFIMIVAIQYFLISHLRMNNIYIEFIIKVFLSLLESIFIIFLFFGKSEYYFYSINLVKQFIIKKKND